MKLSTTGNEVGNLAEREVGTIGGYRYSQGRDEPWCGDFASWALKKVGLRDLGSPSVPQIENKAKERGLWHAAETGYRPKRGDLITFNWGRDGLADHIGIVSRVNSDGTVGVVAGNTGGYGHSAGDSVSSGAVALHNFSLKSPAVRGFVSLEDAGKRTRIHSLVQHSPVQHLENAELKLEKQFSDLLAQMLQPAKTNGLDGLLKQYSEVDKIVQQQQSSAIRNLLNQPNASFAQTLPGTGMLLLQGLLSFLPMLFVLAL